MPLKTSILLSIGISAALIAAAIWLLLRYCAGMWIGGGHWGVGHHPMMGGPMGLVQFLFWAVLMGAIALLTAGAVSWIQTARDQQSHGRNSLEARKRRLARGETGSAEIDAVRRP